MRGELTREDVEMVAAHARGLIHAYEQRGPNAKFATPNERAAFHALLVAIGNATKDGVPSLT